MGLCLIDVNTLCLRRNLQRCLPLLHWGATLLFFWHWNVVATLRKSRNYGLKKTYWACWTSFIEDWIDYLMVVEDDPVFLWNEFKNLLLEASIDHIPLECISNQSVLFWIWDLTDASHKLQFLRKMFTYKSNFENEQKLKAAKERFEILPRESVTESMEHYLSTLGHKKDSFGLLTKPYSTLNMKKMD